MIYQLLHLQTSAVSTVGSFQSKSWQQSFFVEEKDLHGTNVQQCWQTSELLRFGFKLVERKHFCGRDLLFCVCISHGMSDLASKSKFSILF